MTNPFWYGLGAGAVLVGVLWFVQTHRGCTGGHHFPDEPSDVRWKITPYHEDNLKYAVTRVETYECNHEGCYAEESERTFVGDPKHRTHVEESIEELSEKPAYEDVPASEYER